ncbi:hypothetical protein [Hyunsoonleella rubra]|uniref:Cytochrome c domain-containing protein n=1 Tax=Hyunsoonleella rubra TaxID=1737062 RepID=A0ABW5TFI0_9FLAO
MKFKNLFASLAIMALIFNCSSNGGDDLNGPDPDPDPDPMAKVTYNDDIKRIIDANCVRCHGNPPVNNAPFPLTTFTQVRDRVDRIISRTNNSSSPMPPSGLMAQNLRALIQQWKDDGLLEN